MDIHEEKKEEVTNQETQIEQTDNSAEPVKAENNEVLAQENTDTDKKEPVKKGIFGKKNKPANCDEILKKLETLQEEHETLSKKFEEQAEKLQEMNDRYLRSTAEFDNFRKRTLKEKSELIKYGGENILLDIIPVVDNFERAIQSLEKAKDIEAVKEGILLIYGKFQEFITQKGVKEIEAINLDFNTDIHEAVTKIPAPSEEMKGKVVDVIEKGYMLYDKVIRFSKVVVGE